MRNNIKQLRQSANEKDKYNENANTGVIIISGERKNIGVVKYSNRRVYELIGYSRSNLLGQNINVVMPRFIANLHDDVLRNYLELSESKYDFTERLAPMVTKNQFLVFCKILTKPIPSLMNGLELTGFFNTISEKHINHPEQTPKYVLCRSDTGEIQSLSESCYNEFGYKVNPINSTH